VTRIPERTVLVEPGPMQVFSLLTRDPNPIHWDVDAVGALGLGDRPVNQGGLNVGYVIGAVTAWAGPGAVLRDLRVRFHGTVRAGDTVTAGGEVVERRDRTERLEVWLRAADGSDLVTGTATVQIGGEVSDGR
jgi:acyl dehydratase